MDMYSEKDGSLTANINGTSYGFRTKADELAFFQCIKAGGTEADCAEAHGYKRIDDVAPDEPAPPNRPKP